jgi:hypothetical protein
MQVYPGRLSVSDSQSMPLVPVNNPTTRRKSLSPIYSNQKVVKYRTLILCEKWMLAVCGGCLWWRDVTHHIMKIIDDGVMKFKILCSTESLVSFSFFFPSFFLHVCICKQCVVFLMWLGGNVANFVQNIGVTQNKNTQNKKQPIYSTEYIHIHLIDNESSW